MIYVLGGGTSLNYSVVGGTTEPTSPKENMIWVNTETEITSHVFSATEPESPVEGMVWLNVGTSCSAPINVLKKDNTVMLYPVSCKQYVDSAWAVKTAKTYQNGAWVEWALFIYTIGNTYDNITGGWSSDDIEYGTSTHKLGTISIGDSGIVLTTSVNSERTIIAPVGTVNTIDLTDYSALRVTVTKISGTLTVATGTAKKYHFNDASAKKAMTAIGVYDLDISGVSGFKYVWFNIGSWQAACNATITEIELIK